MPFASNVEDANEVELDGGHVDVEGAVTGCVLMESLPSRPVGIGSEAAAREPLHGPARENSKPLSKTAVSMYDA